MSSVELGKYMVAMQPVNSPSGKTKVWPIHSVSGPQLGTVSFLGRWRCYVFRPMPETVFNAGCMRELVEFCDKHTEEWRKR